MPTLRRAMKKPAIQALLLVGLMALPAAAQQRVFDWVRDNDESVRLTPGLRQKTHLYNPGQGGNIKLEVTAQKPVTVAIVQRRDWDDATQDPQAIYRPAVTDHLQYRCVQEHVLSTIYSCYLPASDDSVALILRDERAFDHAVLAGVGNALGVPHVADAFGSANEVRLQYYRWSCVENCYPPQFRGVRLAKEKYQLTTVLKAFSLPLPEHDGEQVDVKLKSSVPMLVAVVPSDIAQQLYSKPEMLQSAVAGGICQQRAAQSVNFGCELNPNGAAQSLILIPEPNVNVPAKSKAQIELTSVKCVANCQGFAN
ncbi:MAG TPA: hypothetical protein VNX88_09550 [Terriglobales bacterium]|jgi:hypothetical protein|nr:hypothetical protein [Terriglobales bacterium]